ncbi:response regulator transcription factor [Paenibacillus sp. GSMTC-2017]|uniref:response regulator transcription factor n=1 Tax=Paenibacillus sp. GSMTC-2017 TaxID=2794350 RepID=UPI0018D61A89|nr:response regulator transcription factor [Paenibacillus sp. GSMTC-2017]MBH5318411.1 response regulator transcription factor [Paenibacillus sp. GSMTC-2017]
MDNINNYHILVADDDSEICDVIELLLSCEGFRVTKVANGNEAIEKVDNGVDLIILDVMMPEKSGFLACAEIRKKTTVPILFLTAKSQDSDKVLGFSAGADDFLSKPFSNVELLSRVKSQLRRYFIYQGKNDIYPNQQLVLKDLTLEMESKAMMRNGNRIDLTETEYQILLLMMSHRNKVFSAENLYESIWNEPYYYDANNTLMVHIRNIRKKLGEDPKHPRYIKTAWGKGYYVD